MTNAASLSAESSSESTHSFDSKSSIGHGFWQRLKVSQRIKLGFSLALGLMFAGTGVSILVGNFYQSEALKAQAYVQEEIELLSRLQTGVLQARTHQQQLIPLSESPQAFQEEYNHILKHAETISTVITNIYSYSEKVSQKEDSLELIDLLRLNEFIETHGEVPKEYLRSLDQLVNSIDVESLSTPEQVEKAQAKLMEFTNSELAISFDGVSDDLSGFIESAREELETAREVSQNALRLRDWIIGLSMLASSGIAAFLALRIGRSISSPLKAVEETASQITQNDNFDLRVDVCGAGEIGTVATAFNLLIQRVNNLLKEQTIRNAELAESNQQLISTQKQMIEQEKLASLGSLTAGIAHEIKNPLNFVNNFSELSIELVEELSGQLFEDRSAQIEQKRNKPIDAATFEEIDEILSILKENLEKIEHHGKRADKIVANMLQHSRGGDSREWAEVDFNELIADAVSLAYHGTKAKYSDFDLSIDSDYGDDVGTLCVCAQSLGRVFLNLVSNACYAVYQKQRERGEDFQPLLKVRSHRTEKAVSVWIRDNGVGMSEAVKSKVFNQFFTTKPPGEGTGLGLSLSYNIVVEQHKGTIEVDSEEGIYTDFVVTIPTDLGASQEESA